MHNDKELVDEEKKNRRISLIITVSAHVLVVLGFIFTMAWTPPDPPIPKYGIQINLGLEEIGGGSQPMDYLRRGIQ